MNTGDQIKEQDGVYHLILQTAACIDLFSRQAYRDRIIDNIKYCQQQKGYYKVVIINKTTRREFSCGSGEP